MFEIEKLVVIKVLQSDSFEILLCLLIVLNISLTCSWGIVDPKYVV